MKKPIQISIPTPCHENWQQMTLVDKGRFCASCQKNVMDFTESSDREIASVLTGNQNICGRFRSDQLERELFVPTKKKTFWAAASAAAISFLALGTNAAVAQGDTQIENAAKVPDPPVVGDTIIVHKKYRIMGTLKDSEESPVPNAKIAYHDKAGCIVTDANGKFAIEAEEGEEIQLDTPANAFITFEPDPSRPKNIKIRIWQSTSTAKMGLTSTITKKRTFIGGIRFYK